MQPIYYLLFRGNVGFSLFHLRLHTSGIESGHHLPNFHVIALLDQHLGYTLTGVEWQIRLPQIHVAIQNERVRGFVSARYPPRDGTDGHDGNNEQNPQDGFGH
jgi:hypothetical protein